MDKLRLTGDRITNIAALSLLAATYLEKERGFWTANLLALSSSWIGLILLIVFSDEFGMQLYTFSVDTSLISIREAFNTRRRTDQECDRPEICSSRKIQH